MECDSLTRFNSSIRSLLESKHSMKISTFFSNSGLSFPDNQTTSFAKLYEKIIDAKLNEYVSTYGKSQFTKKELIDMHIYLSINLFFPDKLKHLNFKAELDAEEILKIGIVESLNKFNSAVFIHRSFAEYFLALSATELITSEFDNGREEAVAQFIFKDVLATVNEHVDIDLLCEEIYSYEFKYPFIINFVNLILENSQSTISKSLSNIIRLPIYKPTLARITYALVSSKSIHLLNFFKNTYAFQQHGRTFFTNDFLYLAGLRADFELFKVVLDIYKKLRGEPISIVLLDVLRIAIARGDFSIVQFLLNEESLQHSIKKLNDEAYPLLHDCVMSSKCNSPDKINQKIEIIRLLVQLNRRLIQVRGKVSNLVDFKSTPILSRDAHVQLILELIKLGADVFAKDDFNNTILHSPSPFNCNMKPEEYHLLVANIPPDLLKKLVHVQSKSTRNRTPLADIIEFIDPNLETLELFKKAEAAFNFVNELGDCVLGTAILNGRKASTIRNLIKLGADVNYVNERGELILSTALEINADYHVVKALVEGGADVNYVQKVKASMFNGLPPLGIAILQKNVNVYIVGKLIAGGANVNFITKTGYSLLDLAIIRGHGAEVIRVLIEAGCELTWRSRWTRKSVLHYAARYGSVEVIELLYKQCTNVNSKSWNFKTPFAYVNKFGKKENYEVLKELRRNARISQDFPG